MAEATPERAVWAALLTPQGKYLADFFILAAEGRLLLDVEAGQRDDLARRLERYRLRARVRIAPDPLAIYAGWAESRPSGHPYNDPRRLDAGWRAFAAPGLAPPDQAAWDAHRIPLGLPDGTRDLEPDRTVLLEANFDTLNGISWTKGCYLGQELTARTRYRGLLKRRLLPVRFEAAAPPPGTPVLADDGREVGALRSTSGPWALATLRLDSLAATLTANGHPLQPEPASPEALTP